MRHKQRHRFVILTAGRSGSNFLYGALQHHPDIVCFGELFEDPSDDELRDKSVTLRPKHPKESPASYCEHVVFPHLKRFGAVGFKLKYYHLDRTRLAHYLRMANVRILHNRRRNHLAQSLSTAFGERHAFVYRRCEVDDEVGLYQHPMRVDVQEIIKRMKYILTEERRMERKFQRHLTMHNVFYEDVCYASKKGDLLRHKEVNEILDVLGVERKPLRSNYLKQRRRPYSELIVNFDALRSALVGCRPEWSRYLETLEDF